jgi:hypothetical protein
MKHTFLNDFPENVDKHIFCTFTKKRDANR